MVMGWETLGDLVQDDKGFHPFAINRIEYLLSRYALCTIRCHSNRLDYLTWCQNGGVAIFVNKPWKTFPWTASAMNTTLPTTICITVITDHNTSTFIFSYQNNTPFAIIATITHQLLSQYHLNSTLFLQWQTKRSAISSLHGQTVYSRRVSSWFSDHLLLSLVTWGLRHGLMPYPHVRPISNVF